ncbi:MAG: hypothetical protein ABIP30_16660 [Ferruginibacter sp.]
MPKFYLLISLCLFFTSAANAGTPVNGTTAFNSVSAGVKASGNAGTGSGITAANVEGFNFKLNTTASGPVMVIEVWDGAVSSGNGVAFYESTSSINPLFSGITITANDGSKFDLTSIGINAQSSGGGNTTVTITGLNSSGTAVSGATATAVASVSALTNFNVSGNAAFKGIYGIKITCADIVYAFIDNIALVNVTTLPLTWLDFSAKKQDNNVALKWSTASEQGTTNFIVQHSANGIDWDKTGTTPAAGNSSINKYYSYMDVSPFSGANYYRLIQQDVNGRQTYSKVVYIYLGDQLFHFSVYPTVVSDGVLNVKLERKAIIQIFNSVGNKVLSKELQPGIQQLKLGVLPAGVYRIKAATETISFIIPQ